MSLLEAFVPLLFVFKRASADSREWGRAAACLVPFSPSPLAPLPALPLLPPRVDCVARTRLLDQYGPFDVVLGADVCCTGRSLRARNVFFIFQDRFLKAKGSSGQRAKELANGRSRARTGTNT